MYPFAVARSGKLPALPACRYGAPGSGANYLLCSSSMSEVSRLLTAMRQGDRLAAEQLLPLVYDELRQVAARQLAQEKVGQTLEATALVHEAYLRLVGQGDPGWDQRGHFFAAAAEAMRRILVENARRKRSAKHGGGQARQLLDEALLHVANPEPREDLLALDEALVKFSQVDPVAAQLVQLRYFMGMTLAEAAQALDISPRTADRLWAFAKAWLHRELGDPSSHDGTS
jgi:RNA polymerase sigma factor (TIGR02999 family)